MEDEHNKVATNRIAYLAGLARDYIGTGGYDDVNKLNRRLGYCEAILDLIDDLPEEQ